MDPSLQGSYEQCSLSRYSCQFKRFALFQGHQGLLQHQSLSTLQQPLLHNPSPSLPVTSLSGTMTSLAPSLGSLPTPSTPNKKFRPPQKSQRYIPKPIPLELGNLKTYSEPHYKSMFVFSLLDGVTLLVTDPPCANYNSLPTPNYRLTPLLKQVGNFKIVFDL